MAEPGDFHGDTLVFGSIKMGRFAAPTTFHKEQNAG